MPPEVLRGVGRSGRTLWPRCPGLPAVGECPCRRGCSGLGYVRRVVWGYRVKPGGERCLLVGDGGGGAGVVVCGDEV